MEQKCICIHTVFFPSVSISWLKEFHSPSRHRCDFCKNETIENRNTILYLTSVFGVNGSPADSRTLTLQYWYSSESPADGNGDPFFYPCNQWPRGVSKGRALCMGFVRDNPNSCSSKIRLYIFSRYSVCSFTLISNVVWSLKWLFKSLSLWMEWRTLIEISLRLGRKWIKFIGFRVMKSYHKWMALRIYHVFHLYREENIPIKVPYVFCIMYSVTTT